MQAATAPLTVGRPWARIWISNHSRLFIFSIGFYSSADKWDASAPKRFSLQPVRWSGECSKPQSISSTNCWKGVPVELDASASIPPNSAVVSSRSHGWSCYASSKDSRSDQRLAMAWSIHKHLGHPFMAISRTWRLPLRCEPRCDSGSQHTLRPIAIKVSIRPHPIGKRWLDGRGAL